MDNCMQELRSYLGIQSDEELKVKINDHVPDFSVELHEALLLANENSPEIQNMIRRKLESESNVSYARANAGLKADIYLRFGLTQTADKLGSAYKRPLDQQYVSLSVALPIPRLGTGQGQSARGTLQPRPCVHTGGTRQDRFRTKHTQTGETI